MTRPRRIQGISGVRDKTFTPYETLCRIPWPVYSILIALTVWGLIVLLPLDDHVNKTVARTTAVVAEQSDSSSNDISVGHTLFGQFCATCHQQEGIGLTGAVPPLTGSSIVTGDPRVPIGIVLMGVEGPLTVNGTVFNGRMPTFRNTLTDQEIAAVVTYIRQAWANDADPVTTKQVSLLRAELKDQPTPLTGDQGVQGLRQTVISRHSTDRPAPLRDQATSAVVTTPSEAL
ncbi:MAG: cytochrome c [Halothiobacillaceae bacterium]